jgi:DNA-binding beta-propeller fold protein YncE
MLCVRRAGARRAAALLGVGGIALACTALSPVGAVPAAHHDGRPKGDIRVFAHIGKPGEPSLSLVTPHHHVYVGTFEDAAGTDTSPSKVFKYSRHGKLHKTFVIHGQTPGAAHGVQVAERDRQGRLYVLDQSPARVVVLNPKTGHQRTYATFDNLPTCSASGKTKHCSNTIDDGAPEPDYAAWLPDGSLLVTDYSQQVVWRVPPHGGAAKVWLNNKQLDGELFGPAGIVLMPNHRSLLMTVATGGVTTAPPTDNASNGRLYRIKLTRHYHVRRLVSLWSSAAGQAPDGFAVSRNHRHVYVALAGPTGNSVDEVAHKAHGWRTVWHAPKTVDGVGSSPVVWDTATSVQFLGGRILVTNQAYFTDIASHWVVFNIAVGGHGLRLYVPKHAGGHSS